MQSMPKDFQLVFLKKEQIAKDVWTFYFDRKGKDIDFVAGQFIRMTLVIENPDERGRSRTFSLSSSPLDNEYITITTRVLESSFKKTLAQLTPGTKVDFFGPNGRFVLADPEKHYVFLVGGIGITPVHSMMRFASQSGFNVRMTLLASFSTPEEMIFYDELETISKSNQNVKIVYTVTKPELSQGPWAGEKGRISQDLIKKYVPNVMESSFYVSGPPAMVDAMLALVKEMGVPDEQVKKEKFAGY